MTRLLKNGSENSYWHTFATRSVEHGIPYKVLQIIMGHSDLVQTL